MAETHNAYQPSPGVPAVLVENANTITRRIALHLLFEPPDAMRHDIDDEGLIELAHSIREVGVLNDLCVIPIRNGLRVKVDNLSPASLETHERAGGTYQVRAGHRRLLACRSINLESVTCKVFCDPATSELAIMAHENAFREEPSDYDLAVLYSGWMQEPGLTEDTLRRRAGKTLEFIYRRAAILQGWDFVATALHERKINFGAARAINTEEDENYAKMFLNMAVDQGATAKLVTAWVSAHKAEKDMTPPGSPAPDMGAPIVVAVPEPVECALCGERQNYLLRSALLCVSDLTRIKQARAEVDANLAAQSDPDATKG
jgi:ParB-like chromosome segregation protein Spo0J